MVCLKSGSQFQVLPGTDFHFQIDGLRVHIHKGCLSGNPPGFGTERNEQLHRLLNRLNRYLLSGATRISIELAVAL